MIGVHQACQLCGSLSIAVDYLDSVVVLLVGSLESAVAGVDWIIVRSILWLASCVLERFIAVSPLSVLVTAAQGTVCHHLASVTITVTQ